MQALKPPAILPPIGNTSFDTFVLDVVAALRERPLHASRMRDQRSSLHNSLNFFLGSLATRALATDGEWAEFGVFSGTSTRRIAGRRFELSGLGEPASIEPASWRCHSGLLVAAFPSLTATSLVGSRPTGSATREVHGFDAFRGLPETWHVADRGYKHEVASGAFNLGGHPPYSDWRIKWHVGWFNHTAPAFARELTERGSRLSFVHIDGDLYSSSAQVFEALERLIAPGAYIVFDECAD
eukprot:3981170-Prymnesium_polylepis.1